MSIRSGYDTKLFTYFQLTLSVSGHNSFYTSRKIHTHIEDARKRYKEIHIYKVYTKRYTHTTT